MSNKPRFVGEKVRLGDVLKSSSTRNKDNHCVNVYSVTNSKGFVPSEEYFSKEVFSKELKTYRVVARDMIAYNPSRINVGSVALQDKADEVVVSPLYVVFSTDRSKLIPEYLVHFLKSKPGLGQIAFQSIGTVRNNLKFKALCQMELSIPSLEEQEARLKTLREIQLQITQAEAQIEKLEHLVKSRFVEMFGDPCEPNRFGSRVRIDSFCELRIGPFGSSLHKEDYIEGGHELINPSHIVSGKLCPDSALSINDEKFVSMSSYHLHIGDVVLGRRGEIGRCAVVDREGLICGTGSMILRPGAECRSDYLQRVISFPSFSHALEGDAVGVTMKNLNAKIVGSAEVYLPPIKLQERFAAFVQQVDKSRFIAQQQIEKLQMLYDSLAQDYFGV